MRLYIFMSIFLTLFSIISLFSQTIEAVRTIETIVLDGKLEESIWNGSSKTNLKQSYPNEGADPTETSEVWLAYDEQSLYVAARLHDASPDSIIDILARRDSELPSDWFTVYIDPYHDKRTGYYFSINAGGTISDGTLYNDDWSESTWDGIWEAKSLIDQNGWCTEMRIPFSQLRYTEQKENVWGINFRRLIGRKNERDFLVYTPLKESGFVSRFVDLNGLQGITSTSAVEILPYVTTRAEYIKALPGDPFNSGKKFIPDAGFDLKVGLSSSLTLNATVNPDFGQVEVDPAVVNLSDVETFFQERRPFFIEGANTFRFGSSGASSNYSINWMNPMLFYSRRIGRAPQGSLPESDFANYPLGTHILSAGKLTGKLGETWNVGTLHALTQREHAEVDQAGNRSRVEVEPITYYGVTRMQGDFSEGKQGMGVIATYTGRMFDDERLRDELNSNALALGADGWTFLDQEKTYVLTGWLGLSNVTGTQARIINLQRSSRHYFQRPDAKGVRVDSSATSMTGFAGRFMLNKQKGASFFSTAIGFINPEYEINDLGYISWADVINWHAIAGYRWTEPTDFFRSLSVSGNAFGNFDFDGVRTWLGYFVSTNIELLNFYRITGFFAYNPVTYSTRETRGGPIMYEQVGRQFNVSFESDTRKPFGVELGANYYLGKAMDNPTVSLYLSYRPLPSILVSIGPEYARYITKYQWVGSYSDPLAVETYGNRYVFANFDQRELATTFRLNWTFTPRLSVQVYTQQLFSSGEYINFKEFLQPKTDNFRSYGTDGSTISEEVTSTGATLITVDADGAGAAVPYLFSNPDFNFKSLRVNAVLRWEYLPGSTLYLVWTQNRQENEESGDFYLGHSVDRLVNIQPDNIFMVKLSYWLNP